MSFLQKSVTLAESSDNNKKSDRPFENSRCHTMRRRGLEPPCLSAPAPQAGVSTNSTIAA